MVCIVKNLTRGSYKKESMVWGQGEWCGSGAEQTAYLGFVWVSSFASLFTQNGLMFSTEFFKPTC